jgi:hypothetical protein
MAAQDHPVDAQVEGQHDRAQGDLDPSGEPRGVQHRQEIVLDEASAISRLSASPAKPVLQRRERTDPPLELDQRPPDRRRKVQQHDPAPAKHQKSAGNHEQHEEEMQADNKVGEDAVGQRSSEM